MSLNGRRISHFLIGTLGWARARTRAQSRDSSDVAEQATRTTGHTTSDFEVIILIIIMCYAACEERAACW